MIWSNSLAFASMASRSSVRAGMRELVISITAATCIAVGNLSNYFSTDTEIKNTIYERIVAALTHVHMVVWMHRLLGAQFASKDFDSPVRNNLSSS